MKKISVILLLALIIADCATHHKVFYKKRVYFGLASWYGKKHHGKRTASGEIFNMYAYTAAHRFLPFGSIVKVTNLKNGKSVIVRINDRGPFKKGRIIDLSYIAARKIGMINDGVVRVKLEVLKFGKGY